MRALRARAGARPARVAPGAVQRARADHAAVGGARCAGAAARAGAARRGAAERRAPRTSTSRPAPAPASRWCAPDRASAAAEAEFMIGALLPMLRRVPVVGAEGLLVGRELGGCHGRAWSAWRRRRGRWRSCCGPSARGWWATTRRCMPSDALWARWQRRAAGPARADGAERRGVRAADLLHALPGPARRALPAVLQAQPGAGEPGALEPVRRGGAGRGAGQRPHGRGLVRQPGARRCWTPGGRCTGIDTLQVTPRVASTTRESRVRSAWAVARRIDELLQPAAPPRARASGRRPPDELSLILQTVQRPA